MMGAWMSKQKPKLPDLTKRYEVSGDTGEIIRDLNINIQRVTDRFGVVFADNFYHKLVESSLSLPVTFWKMITKMDSGNTVYTGKPFKMEMIHKDKNDLTEDSISNQIYLLAKHNITKKLGTNYYVMNPNYLAKGNMLYIAKLRLQYDLLDKL